MAISRIGFDCDAVIDQEKFDDAIAFMDSWLDSYPKPDPNNPNCPNSVVNANIINMCIDTYFDVCMGRRTNGNYHDNQCVLHGLFSQALGR